MNYRQAFEKSLSVIEKYRIAMIDMYRKRNGAPPQGQPDELRNAIAYIALAVVYMRNTNKLIQTEGAPEGLVALMQNIDLNENPHPQPDLNVEFVFDNYLRDLDGPMTDEEFRHYHKILWDAMWNPESPYKSMPIEKMWSSLEQEGFPRERFRKELERRGILPGEAVPDQPKTEVEPPQTPAEGSEKFAYHPSKLVQFKEWIKQRGWSIYNYQSTTGQLQIIGENKMTNQKYPPLMVNPNDIVAVSIREAPSGKFCELYIAGTAAE